MPARRNAAEPPQKGLRDTTLQIHDLLNRLNRRVTAEQARHLKPLGLTPPQAAVLAALADGPRKIAELTGRVELDPSTLVGVIDRLEAREWVRRGRDPNDRRANPIELTPRGRRLLKTTPPLPADSPFAGAIASLKAPDRRQLLALLDDLAASLGLAMPEES